LCLILDRAITSRPNFKRFNLQFVNQPVRSGALTTVTTSSGQKLFVNTLLPAGASLNITVGSMLEGTRVLPIME
jgi:hypothetical protein